MELLGISVFLALLFFGLAAWGLWKQRVEFPNPFIEHFSWRVEREELPFFYWLGILFSLLGGVGCVLASVVLSP